MGREPLRVKESEYASIRESALNELVFSFKVLIEKKPKIKRRHAFAESRLIIAALETNAFETKSF